MNHLATNAAPEACACDHDFHLIDDSFDHEFGTEIVLCLVCDKCGESRPTERARGNFEP